MKYFLSFVLGLVLAYYQTTQWHEQAFDKLIKDLSFLDEFLLDKDCYAPEGWEINGENGRSKPWVI